jgi:hypothetical protein
MAIAIHHWNVTMLGKQLKDAAPVVRRPRTTIVQHVARQGADDQGVILRVQSLSGALGDPVRSTSSARIVGSGLFGGGVESIWLSDLIAGKT